MMITAQAELSQYLYSDPIPYQQLQFAHLDGDRLSPKPDGEEVGNKRIPSTVVMDPCPSGDRKNRAS